MRQTARTMLGAILWAAWTCAAASASETITQQATLRDFLVQHVGSAWSGPAELWIDPLGNDTETSDATLRIDGDRVRYTWSFEIAGELRLGDVEFQVDREAARALFDRTLFKGQTALPPRVEQ